MSRAIAALLLGATSSAFAYDGFATGNVNLRAGPDIEYPIVTTIPAGAPLSIQGCTDAWEWCDVIFADTRGWVAGNYIQYEYNDQPVLLSGYGAAIGVPIVSFVIADYWGHYYRNRPFWAEHEHWYAHPYVRHAPPAAFHGPVHDWGHDYHAHGYSGHGGDYHDSHHGGGDYHDAHNGGGDYHGSSHGSADYHATSGAAYSPSHGGTEYHGTQHAPTTAHTDTHATQQVSHNVQNGQQPQGQHADAYHGPTGHTTTSAAQQVHAAPAAQQVHAAPAAQHGSSSSHEKSSSHDKHDDKDHGHR